MKSRPIGPGQTILASQNNDKRDDGRGGGFLLAHQQLGTLALGTEPTNGQVVPIVINGTTITVTAVTSIGSTANNVLIDGSALAFVTNLINFLRRPDLTNSTQVAASSANQTLLQYVGWAWPASSTNVVPFSLNKNVNGNTDVLTSFNITGITVTSGAWTAQTMQLYVEDGTYYIAGTRYLFTGSSTPTVTAPVSHPRIDVLAINSSGTLSWTTGTENASPVAPTYPANQVPICELYNVVSETALYDNENQQSGQGYIYNDVRPMVQNGVPYTALPSNLVPATTDTYDLGTSSSAEWLSIYAKNIYASSTIQINGQNVGFQQFGGTGASGALTVTSGTTTINLGGASVFVANYSSISITGTGNIAFSNPNASGTIIILKCSGACTITSSATAAIDMTSATGVYTGSAGGNGGTTGGGGSTQGGGTGGGGASANGNGSQGTGVNISSSGNGSAGSSFGTWGFASIVAAQGGVSNNSSAVSSGGTVTPALNSSSAKYYKVYVLPGGGGGGGGTGNDGAGSGGAGGAGGGALYIECAGALNFTGTINANGQNGPTSSSVYRNGSGGGGGAVVILYNTLTANTGTITTTAGTGGSGSYVGAAGASGFSLVAQNTEFT